MDWFPLGDSAWLCQPRGPSAREQILRLREAMEAASIDGITDIVISYETLAIHFPPGHGEAVREQVARLTPGSGTEPTRLPRIREIPTDYHDPASEIASLAARLRLSVDEVIRRHSAPEYEVAAIGFSPGFPYLVGLDPNLFLPRKPSPTRIPRGAVAIAGSQTGIYPDSSPGGWHVLGITDVTLFSPDAGSLLQAGDQVRFVPITQENRRITEDPPHEEMPDHATIGVIDPGPFTSIQDLGRAGHRADGVSVGGCLDPIHQFIANHLVGNPAASAALECAGTGPLLQFLKPSTVAWCGWADGSGRPHRFQTGDLLDLRSRMTAATGTVAISGGIDAPLVLGSRSTDIRARFGGQSGRRLRAGDLLATGPESSPAPLGGSWHVGWPVAPSLIEVRVLRGIQSHWFLDSSLRDFLSRTFTKSTTHDRTGMRLDGPPLRLREPREMISQPVACGSLQVPPDGSPIVLLSECQTIGGYPQIAHVISADIPLLARALPGTAIRFREVDLPSARSAWFAQRKELALLRASLSLKT